MVRQLIFALAILFTGLSFSAHAQDKELKPYYNIDEDGLWVEGYDPVAYFTDKKAIKGSKNFAVVHKGATFWFASKAHQDAFKASPDKYLPQYGGYCAYAVGAYAGKVEVDPETFKLKDGKLYLFYNKFFTNTLTDWNKDEVKLHTQAEKNWAAYKHAK